jgi:hypothetical protein
MDNLIVCERPIGPTNPSKKRHISGQKLAQFLSEILLYSSRPNQPSKNPTSHLIKVTFHQKKNQQQLTHLI